MVPLAAGAVAGERPGAGREAARADSRRGPGYRRHREAEAALFVLRPSPGTEDRPGAAGGTGVSGVEARGG